MQPQTKGKAASIGAFHKGGPDWNSLLAEMKSWWTLFKDTAANWSAHKDARQGAALAYYSVFSLGPLMVIAIAIAGLVFGQEAVRGQVGAQLQGLLGDTGAQAVQAMLSGARSLRKAY